MSSWLWCKRGIYRGGQNSGFAQRPARSSWTPEVTCLAKHARKKTPRQKAEGVAEPTRGLAVRAIPSGIPYCDLLGTVARIH